MAKSTPFIPGLTVAVLIVMAASPAAVQTTSGLPLPELAKSWQDAYNRKDAAAVANLYTEDAIRVVPSGIMRGREAIQRNLEASLNAGGHGIVIKPVADHVDGNSGWSITEWSARTRGQDGAEMPINGFAHVTLVRVGNDWKIRVHSVTPASPPRQ